MAYTKDIKRTAFARVLLLLQLLLLGTQCVAEECGTKFVDPSSSTVLAQIVVQGKVDSMMPAAHHSQTHSANVTIGKVYKGMNVLKEMGIPPEKNVMIDKFGPETDRDECVADMSATEGEQEFLFFLRPSSSPGVLQMTALPLPAEHNVKETVEGSLCATCVSPPEIQRVKCRQCAHAPVITKGKGRKVRIGQKARIGCYAKGKPPPRFSWTKSGVPLTSGSAGVVIKSTNTSSILIIRKAARIHSGQYTCKAENDIGDSERELVLEVTKRVRPLKPKYNVRNAPDKRVCDRVVCLNGGTCYYSPSLDLSFCKCTDGFEGVKCENDISEPARSTNWSSRVVSNTDGAGMIPCAQRNVRSICLNGGTCFIKLDSLICSCPRGFDGDRCQELSESPDPSNESTTIFDSSASEVVFETSTLSFETTTGFFVTSSFNEVNSDTSGTTAEYKEKFSTGQTSAAGSTFSSTLGPKENEKSTVPVYHSNVDEEALKIIRHQIASNNLETDECGLEFSRFCLNGGTCRYVRALSVAVCTCPTDFSGTRCETRGAEIQPLRTVTTSSVGVQGRVSPTVISKVTSTSTAEPTTAQITRKQHSILDNADHVTCPSTNICQNGATCYYSISMARTLCICPAGFEGARCEKSVSSTGNYHSREHQRVSEVLSSQIRKGSSPAKISSDVDDIDDKALSGILTRLKSNRIKARRCKSKGFCLNNGKCRYIHKLSLQVCLCRKGYTGRRCQNSK